MDEKKKLIVVSIAVVLAVGAAIFMGVGTLGGEKVQVVGELKGVSKDAEMGKVDADPSGDLANTAPVVNAAER